MLQQLEAKICFQVDDVEIAEDLLPKITVCFAHTTSHPLWVAVYHLDWRKHTQVGYETSPTDSGFGHPA